MKKNAFERYAPFIQKYIYRKQWTDLREVQVEACEAILDTNKHVIIASGTASGKTEAAFFPVLTLLDKDPSDSVGIMYIGPLKALINDQFERLTELLDAQDIPVWPWHGDVSQSMKQRAVKVAQGVLQITPESLEALLMRNPGNAMRLFSDLRFIIIDEIHALMGEDRGLQVLCLLSRLEKITGCSPRRIGLSATLNDYQPAMDFLSSGTKKEACAVGIQHRKRTIALSAESFFLPDDEEQASQVMRQYKEFVYDQCHTKKCLIFTNSRGNAEQTIADMKQIAAERKEKDIFYVHHGSIAASLRQEAEHALRDNAGPTVAAATLTLELGIDIGDLDSTIQLGAPYSCNSFVQRLGRSGRRTGKSQMMFVDLFEEKSGNPFEMLPWTMLRAIAIIQLYLEERWVEPFKQKQKPFSLLAHQTISTLMTNGEMLPRDLARSVLLLPAFKDRVSLDEYKQLLLYMIDGDYLQRMDNGCIIVGLKGERIANHYTFYAVFQEEETFRVMAKEGEIGTLTSCPAIDETFVLGGRSWLVLSIDENRKIVYVTNAKHTRIPSWTGGGGDIHSKVMQRMKRILLEDTIYPYLQPRAIKILTESRTLAAESGILSNAVFQTGRKSFILAPWCGSKELRTISNLLSHGLKQPLEVISVISSPYYLQVTSSLKSEEFFQKIHELEIDVTDPANVLPEDIAPMLDKYDSMVPKSLLREAYLRNQVDVPRAMQILAGISSTV